MRNIQELITVLVNYSNLADLKHYQKCSFTEEMTTDHLREL